MAARKIETFRNGVPYIAAGAWAGFFAWLIDFVMYVLGFAVGFVALAGVLSSKDVGGGVILGIMGGLLIGVPLLYGALFFRGGRALGGVVTGTRLVRIADGERIGAKGPWAMLVRTILLPMMIIGVLTGGGNVDATQQRVSIDVVRTHRMRAERQAGIYPARETR
ncbi:MAG TPA: RDD family protein [Phytomonospora sp.]